MDNSFYKEFLTIVDSKNFADAADKLSVSTSALSRHLQAAELELGKPLFTRTGRGVVLNEYGELFLPYARAIYEQHCAFTKALDKKIDRDKHTITICGSYQLNALLFAFKQENPRYHISQIPARPSSIALLKDGSAEVAFFVEPGEPECSDDVEIKYVTSDRHIVALPGSHPLANSSKIPLSALKDFPFISLIDRGSDKQMNSDLFELAGFEPHIVFSVSTGEEAMALVSQDLGATILFGKLAAQSPLPNVRLVDIENVEPMNVYACRRKDVRMSKGAQLLWDYLDSAPHLI